MDWPKGIRPRGRGIQIRLWRGGRVIFQETVRGDPYNKADLKAAIERRNDLKARLRSGLRLRDDDDTQEAFADVAQRWLNSLQIDPDTVEGYRGHLNRQWMPAYASWPLSEITRADISERLAASGLAIKTQKNALGPLRMVLQHGGVNPNPAANWAWPKKQQGRRRSKVHRYLPKERGRLVKELRKLADKRVALTEDKPTQKNRTGAHWAVQGAAYFPLLFATGLRPGEALGLLWRDYDGEFLNVDKQYTRGHHKDGTKTGTDRRVYVPKWMRPILDAHSTRFAGGPIFAGFRGEALKDTKRLNPVWAVAHNKARIPLRSPYTCRHTRAAELLSRGVSPAEAAYELGHSVQMFLDKYSEFIEEYAGQRDYSKFDDRSFTDQEQDAVRPRLKNGS